ncbi:MAG: importin-alpha export receptor [Trichoglossum hirsutum]|nr:MAG: importin-alpha export receptor [Trichoglossum hirsutum]
MATAALDPIAQLLQSTLDPRQNKQAEQQILQAERSPNFSLLLLQIVASDHYPYTTRLASALCFKNLIKRNWTDEDGNHKLPDVEVIAIKQELIGLMTSTPPGIQSQLGDAISVIADSDFWQRWESLVDDLVSRLTPDNATINNGVLQVAHSIFKRWRPLFRSDDLFTEVNFVLSKFGAPFLTLFENTDRLVEENKNNKEVLQQVFVTLNLIVKLFNDLSCQDLPPIFEENLPTIMALLHKYLTYDNPLLRSSDDSESGSLEFVKAGICEVLILYVQKYEDAFGPLVGGFITSVWNLLTTVGPQTKYDILVSKALHFLSAVTHTPSHAQNFNDRGVLGDVVEKVILPNISLRESDIELFEDEPIEFIRRDLEGSDSDTRRRAATDFLRALLEQFEKLITEVVSQYINHYLSDYSNNPKGNWKSKDTAVYLFSSIAAKGVSTTAGGVKDINPLVDIVDFLQKNIANDLIADTGVEAILKVDAMKYLYTFRSRIHKLQWQQALPLVAKHLNSPEYVVHTYAAITIERVLYLQVFDQPDVLALSKDLIEHLFLLIEKEEAPEKIQENEFLMKCVMRVLIVIRDGIIPNTDSVLAHLIKITDIISKNPSNPRFYYYHFEAIGALIRFAAPSQPDKLEQAFGKPFAFAVQESIQEFIPYVFQLFAALLEANPSASLPDYYKSLIPSILMPILWESKGNVPALVKLVTSIIPRGASEMSRAGQVEPVLGVFQKLVSTKANESYGFDILESIITHFPADTLQPYFVHMFNIMLLRLQNSKTETFSLRFVRFYHFLSARSGEGLGTDFVINITEQIQSGVFTPLYTSIILPDTQKLSKPFDRKTAVVSLTKTITESRAFAEKYKKGWAFTADSLLTLLADPPVAAILDDAIGDPDIDDMSFGVGFTQLHTCKRLPRDPWPEARDTRLWVGQQLAQANARTGGAINTFIHERLSPESRQKLLSLIPS